MGQNVPNSSCHFSKHKSVSAQILHHSSVITYNYSISFWLKHNTLSTKVAHQSANFYTCHCLHKNSPNSSCHFWDQKSVSLQTLHHSSVSWDVTLLCTFHLKLHMVWTKRAHQSANFQTFDCSSCFKSRVNFLSNFASPFSVMKHNTYEIFYLKHYVLDKRSTSKYIFRLLSVLIKVHPILHAIFENTSLGFIQVLNHCSVLWKITPVSFEQKEPIKKTFPDFWVVGWKFIFEATDFCFRLCIILQCHEITFLFFFWLKLCMIRTKGTRYSAKFQTFDCSC